jgi:hypothetical protein
LALWIRFGGGSRQKIANQRAAMLARPCWLCNGSGTVCDRIDPRPYAYDARPDRLLECEIEEEQ